MDFPKDTFIEYVRERDKEIKEYLHTLSMVEGYEKTVKDLKEQISDLQLERDKLKEENFSYQRGVQEKKAEVERQEEAWALKMKGLKEEIVEDYKRKERIEKTISDLAEEKRNLTVQVMGKTSLLNQLRKDIIKERHVI